MIKTACLARSSASRPPMLAGWAMVLVFIAQITTAYFITDCPVYAEAGKSVHAGMVNCPLAQHGAGDSGHKGHDASCALCDTLAAGHSMLSITPPVLPVMLIMWRNHVFTENTQAILLRIATAAFAARGPPVEV